MLKQCENCGKLIYPDGAVTLSAADYSELARKAKLYEARERTQAFRMERSAIARDRELAEFVRVCSKTMVVREIVAACVAKFGPKRAPSRSAVYRFQERFMKKPRRPLNGASRGD